MRRALRGAVLSALVMVLGLGCADEESPPESPAGITATQALMLAVAEVNEKGWNPAFISNTGVLDSVTGQEFMAEPMKALMGADLRAGQWVIALYKNTPREISEGGRSGFAYPLVRYRVTETGISKLPEGDLKVPTKFTGLPLDCQGGFVAAARRAIQDGKVGKNRRVSVLSHVGEGGHCSWRFRVYEEGSDEAVEQIHIQARGDGTGPVKVTVLPW